MLPLSPVNLRDTVVQVVQDRFTPWGTHNQAVLAIERASLLRRADAYEIEIYAQLQILTDDGSQLAFTEARVSRSRKIGKTTNADDVRADLYDLIDNTMKDFIVEFEYQVRRNLKGYFDG